MITTTAAYPHPRERDPCLRSCDNRSGWRLLPNQITLNIQLMIVVTECVPIVPNNIIIYFFNIVIK
jgi:hypothetical protein